MSCSSQAVAAEGDLRRAVAVPNPDRHVLYALSQALQQQGKQEEAVVQYREALVGCSASPVANLVEPAAHFADTVS